MGTVFKQRHDMLHGLATTKTSGVRVYATWMADGEVQLRHTWGEVEGTEVAGSAGIRMYVQMTLPYLGNGVRWLGKEWNQG